VAKVGLDPRQPVSENPLLPFLTTPMLMEITN